MRAELAERLRARRPEIEAAAQTRIHAIADPAEVADPEYRDGLRAALKAALDYGLAAIERGEEWAPQIPAVLLTQARIASRSKVSLDTVLRRYFAGYTLLADFLMAEVRNGNLLEGTDLQSLLRSQATLFDRLLVAVSNEHARERELRPDSLALRRAERVRRLLEGEFLETAGLAYEFEAHHMSVIVQGSVEEKDICSLAQSLDCQVLSIAGDEDTELIWLGSRRKSDPDRICSGISRWCSSNLTVAVGEPAPGLAGWRLSHQQARAALRVARRTPGSFARYSDVALLASVLQDDLLAASLHNLYIRPLQHGSDNGAVLVQSLRAYFAAERNVSSAAAELGVSRQAVDKRLRVAEQRLGRRLGDCGVDLDVALSVDALRG
jgi:hypothetical protein